MRYVAIDLGGKRTGLAVGDDESRLAWPMDVVDVAQSADDGRLLLAELVRRIVRTLGDDPARGELVVGLPLNMDGTESPGARAARAWGDRLAQATGRRVHMFDERLTSAEAEWQLAGSGLTHQQKKERRDALAAASLLRSFLHRASVDPGAGDAKPGDA